MHEHNRPDTHRAICEAKPQGPNGTLAATPWDAVSIMNYCGPGNLLSEWDIKGAQDVYGINRNLYLDPAFYGIRHPETAAYRGSGEEHSHYLFAGVGRGDFAAPWFDLAWYRAHGGDRDIIRAGLPTDLNWSYVRAFASIGMHEGRAGSLFWDPIYYLAHNPDVAAHSGTTNFAAALSHWRNFGLDEGRAGSRHFSPAAYLARYPDVAATVGPRNFRAAIAHFHRFGQAEGRDAAALGGP